METAEITLGAMVLIYALLSIPLLIVWRLRIKLLQKAAVSAFRMTIQLVLVGLYLKFIFELNNPWVNVGWIIIMIIIANHTVIRNAGLRVSTFFIPITIGIASSTFLVTFILVVFAIRPVPFYDARYVIPIAGMILGNSLRSNVISLERFYSTIHETEKKYLTYLTMGATRYEATLPYLRSALKASLAPTVATMATIGLVSLPGMMTGQILGGSFPIVAIKYQIAIMIAIFTSSSIATLLNILLSTQFTFNEYDMLREEIFYTQKTKQ